MDEYLIHLSALLLGILPMAYYLKGKDRKIRGILDGFAIGALLVLIVVHWYPAWIVTILARGPLAVSTAIQLMLTGLGLGLVLTLMRRRWKDEDSPIHKALVVLAVVGIGLHTLMEATFGRLAFEHGSGLDLLCRIPLGAAIWMLVARRYGDWPGGWALTAVPAGTAISFVAMMVHPPLVTWQLLFYLQAIAAGMLLALLILELAEALRKKLHSVIFVGAGIGVLFGLVVGMV